MDENEWSVTNKLIYGGERETTGRSAAASRACYCANPLNSELDLCPMRIENVILDPSANGNSAENRWRLYVCICRSATVLAEHPTD